MVPKVLIEAEPVAHSITIEGQEVEVQSALLPIGEIKLDAENPRIKRGLKSPGHPRFHQEIPSGTTRCLGFTKADSG